VRPRIAFVLEQALGHVAYGMSLRRTLSARSDMECVWLEIPFEVGAFRHAPFGIGNNWTLRGSARAFSAIANARRRAPLDALFIHTQTVGLFAAPHMRRIPTLLSLDATPINYDELATSYGDVVHPAPVELAKRFAHRSVMQHAAKFTTWSQWAKDSLVRDYGADESKVTILAPGTTLSDFPAPAQRGARRPGPLRVLFVGGDFKRKGGDLLLEVHAEHFRNDMELHLVTGAELPPSHNVHVYRGLRPHSPELLRLYADADVFALPTRGDCLAVVLGEAMASCLPIITTRVGAHAEAVDDGRSGFVIDMDDRAALTDRLRRFVADPELAAHMGKRSREVGEERFDVVKNANRIGDMLLELAGSRAARPS
jgi:glycosyltransferase involved in cell wall biosynthesis